MKKKPRRSQRKEATLEPYDRVLIVTEGVKTEPNYFDGLVSYYQISTANVEISPSSVGSDPQSIVTTAIEYRDQEKLLGDEYDRVYCVFDRDSHTNFDIASKRARQEGIFLARSWPCFEYWLLLHFEYVRSPFQRTQQRSACEICIASLRVHLKDYRKSTANLFRLLETNLEKAIKSATRAFSDARTTSEENPSTEVHSLVKYLRNLKTR